MVDVQMPLDSQINLKLQNILMLLKRCCNHPYLIEYPLDPATQEFKVKALLDFNGYWHKMMFRNDTANECCGCIHDFSSQLSRGFCQRVGSWTVIWCSSFVNALSCFTLNLFPLQIDEQLVQTSGKFLILDRMLPELKRRGHKVN